MTAAPQSLQTALYSALSSDVALVSLLGEPRIYDGAPRRAEMPFISFDSWAATPLGSDGGDLLVHQVTLTVVSQPGGRISGEAIADQVVHLLDDARLVLADYHLVDLKLASRGSERASDGRTYRSRLQFRGVTEIL